MTTMVHGSNLPDTVTDDQLALVAANERLIPFTIGRLGPTWWSPAYDRADAWQDGWLGLVAAAVRYRPELGKFSPLAVREITNAIRRGQGLAHGRNWRRNPNIRTPTDRTHADPLDDIIEAQLVAAIPGPEEVATVNDQFARAAAAGHRACNDHIDRAVLAWILDPTDDRPCEALARIHGRSSEAIRQRRHRLEDRMAREVTR